MTPTRTRDGYLIVGDSYMLPGQERLRRWGRVGVALGAPSFMASVCYVAFKYGRPTGIIGRKATFASWDAMPTEVRWLTLVAVAAWALAFFSMVGLVLLRQTVADQLLTDLPEEN